MILAIDTTGARGSLALHDGERLIEEVPLYSPDGFSQTIFPSIASLLQRHDLNVGEIRCFAAASGPGSFTGVRVGLAAAKGLAEAAGARAQGISNLQALADCGTASLRAVLADARRGEVYCAVFDAELRPVKAEAVMRLGDFLAALPPGTQEVICPDAAPFASVLEHLRVVEQRTIAAAVARIAARAECADPAALDANYVRRSDAELFWKE